MINMTVSELAKILGVNAPVQNPRFTGISKDTRTLVPGNLYLAIIGETLDGHDYLDEAIRKGASVAIVSRLNPEANIPQILVADTLLALGTLCANWRNRFTLPLIGVTGSNGKTTLKNMIASILRAACNNDASRVLATEGNLNNAIGVPLMLAQLNEHHRLGVIEMGMNAFHEIEYLTQLTKPIVATITNAAESHLQGVNNVAGVAQAKGEIFSGLQQNGVAVLNRDDAFFDYWRKLSSDYTCISFGLNTNADVYATLLPNHTNTHQHIRLHTPAGDIQVALPLLGKHNVVNALAATASALAIHLNLDTIKAGLENVQAAPGRMNEILLANGARIIDDTYNANPFSAHAAILALAQYPGKRIFVLGDMRELGPDAIAMHTLTGQRALDAGIDYLYTLGELSAACTKSFGKNAQHFTDKAALTLALQEFLQSGHTILVKGSHSMHMEEIVANLAPKTALAHAD